MTHFSPNNKETSLAASDRSSNGVRGAGFEVLAGLCHAKFKDKSGFSILAVI